MSEKLIIAYKNMGETPLECLERMRKEHRISDDIPMTYAGRLDPMAEGLMVVLVGEECKNKEKYLGFNKTYEFKILVGFSTDTYDLLGLVNSEYTNSSHLNPLYGGSDDDSEFVYSELIKNILPKFIDTFAQKYPSFSSKTVGGKQLFQLSKDDELPENLPEHEVTIYELSCISKTTLNKEDLRNEIISKISLVKGDFRQKDITDKWIEVLENSNQKEFGIISLICDCSSGTYIRQLVSDIGELIGIPMVTYSIKRTKIGGYSIDDEYGKVV
jgi:tRNA pseudouridine55 synthase